MARLLGRVFAVVVLLAGLLACMREGPTLDEGPTTPSTPTPVTPVNPIAVAPKPSPTPTDPPEDPPTDGGSPESPEGPVSTDPVARVSARVFFVECGGVVVPNSSHAKEAAVGCRIHLDVTAKDSQNRPTQAVGTPKWTWSNPAIIHPSSDAEYTPTLTALAPGELDIHCTVDNVKSNTFHITLK